MGGGILKYFSVIYHFYLIIFIHGKFILRKVSLQVYPTDFMPFVFHNFCLILGLGGGDKSPSVPFIAPPLFARFASCSCLQVIQGYNSR